MAKSKAFTLITFILLIGLVVGLMFFWGMDNEESPEDNSQQNETSEEASKVTINLNPSKPENNSSEDVSEDFSDISTESSTEESTEASDEASEESQTNQPVVESSEPEDEYSQPEVSIPEVSEPEVDVPDNIFISLENALFIGDSRTVGIAEYSGSDATFFSTVGMSVYNVFNQTSNVKGMGTVSLEQVVSQKQFDMVYIMLGINEVGYTFSNTVAKYKDLINFVQGYQPNSVIIIQANLHVTAKREDNVINNNAINGLNALLLQLADGERIFFIDANSHFDDANGNLKSETTSDGVHLYAKYYPEWVDWISRETAKVLYVAGLVR